MQLSLATCPQVEGPVARGLRDFRSLPCNSLTSRTFSHEKHLDKFFKIFVLSVLATCSRLDSVGKITWFAQKGQFLKLFSFPSNFSNCSLFGLFISLTNPPCVSQKSPLFFIISTSFFKNRYGFSYYLTAFHVCSMWFLHF